jgi:hypothetical protein
LVGIAFYLEPQIDELMVSFKEQDDLKYANEHLENEEFYEEVVKTDVAKFEKHYTVWKESVVRFHKLKQEDAI